MSGHNKWSKIKHKKAAGDAKRALVFSKYARLISLESKKSGGDENSPGLRTVIEQAKAENMPRQNIERAVKKGIGGETEKMEAITYEAYASGGAAVIIEALSDNRNRSLAEIKHLLSSHGASLSVAGSASWAFEKEGADWIPKIFVDMAEDDREKTENLILALQKRGDVRKVFINLKK